MELQKLLKNRNNRLMLVILIIGIIIILVSSFADSNSKEAGHKTQYFSREEERLSEILSEINGAGKVSVMISYENGSSDNTSIGRSLADSQELLKPRGVIVVADGASSPSVRNALKEAAVAVMGVGANRVQVYAR